MAKKGLANVTVSVDEQLRERAVALATDNHRLQKRVAELEGRLEEASLVIKGLPKAQWRRDLWFRAYLARMEYGDGTPKKAAAFADEALAAADQRF